METLFKSRFTLPSKQSFESWDTKPIDSDNKPQIE